MIYVIFFFLILLNVLVTIVVNVYDSLRQKKALDSMAKAKVISRQNYEHLQKWINLILCKIDSTQEPERAEDDEIG